MTEEEAKEELKDYVFMSVYNSEAAAKMAAYGWQRMGHSVRIIRRGNKYEVYKKRSYKGGSK